jgi:hypothetical protein
MGLLGRIPKEIHFLENERDMSLIEIVSYRFLPPVFIHRFIVRANKLAKVENIWQSGIFLEHADICAFVEANYKTKQIIIKASRNAAKLVKTIKEELKEIQNEGKVNAQSLISGFDCLLVNEKYLKKFINNKINNLNEMTHNEYIEQLIAEDKIGVALDQLLSGSKKNDQLFIYNTTILLSARFYSNENEKNQNIIPFDSYNVEKSKIIKSIITCLADYEPLQNYDYLKVPLQSFTMSKETDLPLFFINEIKKQFEDEYKKVHRFNKLLSDMKDKVLRQEYEEELELCDINISRIEKRYLNKIKENKPQLPEQNIFNFIKDLELTIIERLNEQSDKLDIINNNITGVY